MKKALAAFVVGLIFAFGLGLSGMTQVTKVFGFLDIFGDWEPALMFVMAGAIGVHAIGYSFIKRLDAPRFDERFHIPEPRKVTASLMSGAFIFGVGWGLAGFCPGPAIVSLSSFEPRPWIFVGSMLVGMKVFSFVSKTRIYSPP